MWAVVDRIEGQRAVLVLEDGAVLEIDKEYLPAEATSGSVVRITISLDREKEEELKKRWEGLRGRRKVKG